MSYPKLHPLPTIQLRIFVEGIWYALNDKITCQRLGVLSTASIVTYDIRSLTNLRDFIRTVDHRCKDIEALVATELTVSMGNKQTVREFLMNQFRHYEDVSYKIIAEKAMASDNERLDRLLKLMKDKVPGESTDEDIYRTPRAGCTAKTALRRWISNRSCRRR